MLLKIYMQQKKHIKLVEIVKRMIKNLIKIILYDFELIFLLILVEFVKIYFNVRFSNCAVTPCLLHNIFSNLFKPLYIFLYIFLCAIKLLLLYMYNLNDMIFGINDT